MPVQQRKAETIWKGNLQGSGQLSVGSNAFGPLTVTFSAWTENANGKTSPEELIAAAHATCFAMAFSNTLNKAGKVPEQLDVNATCTLDRVDGALTITAMDLDVKGQVPGIDAAQFEELAQDAGKNCPVSKALKGNMAIRVKAQLVPAQMAVH